MLLHHTHAQPGAGGNSGGVHAVRQPHQRAQRVRERGHPEHHEGAHGPAAHDGGLHYAGERASCPDQYWDTRYQTTLVLTANVGQKIVYWSSAFCKGLFRYMKESALYRFFFYVDGYHFLL